MSEAWQQGLRELLEASRIGFLASEGERGPESSMVPCAVDEGDLLIHISKLARHTANIGHNPRVGLMICAPEASADSPLALPRVSLAGTAAPVAPEEADAARVVYLARIPDAVALFDFPDFRLFRIRVDEAHWVGGFGKARTIPAGQWYGMFSQ